MNRFILLGALLTLSTGLAQKVITIGGYTDQIDISLVNEMINKFVKPALARDGVEVRYAPTSESQKYAGTLNNQLSAGTTPDVFYLPAESAAGLVGSGRVLALNGLVGTTDFISSLNSAYTFGGKQYGIVKDFNTLTLYYNQDLFEEANVPVPNPNDTWTTFEDKITRVQKALGSGYYGMCAIPEFNRFGAFAASTGWTPFNAQGKSNVLDPRFVSTVTWYTNLVKKGVAVQPSALSASWGGDCFKTGKVAVAYEGAWMLNFIRDQAPNLRFGTTLLPKNPTTKKTGNMIYSVAWAVNTNSKNRAAALKALQALTSKEAQTFILEGGLALPSRKSLQSNAYFKKTTVEAKANLNVFNGASAGFAFPFVARTYGDRYFKPLDEVLKTVMDGQATVQQALQRAQRTIDTLK